MLLQMRKLMFFSVLVATVFSSLATLATSPRVTASSTSGEDCLGIDCSELIRSFDFNMGTGQDSIYSTASITSRDDGKSFWCKEGLLDPKCAFAESITSHQSLAMCDLSMSFDCVESLTIEIAPGEVIVGTVIGSVNAVPAVGAGIERLGPFVPDLLVQFSTPDNGLETYRFSVPVAYQLARIANSDQYRVSSFYGGNFQINQVQRTSRAGVNQNPYRCIPIDSESCWTVKSDGVLRRFKFVIRRDQYPSAFQDGWGTWKSASFGDPVVTIDVLSTGPRRLRMQVEANQIEIPGVAVEYKWANRDERSIWSKIDEKLLAVDRWESRPWCGGPGELGLVDCPPLRGTFLPHSKLVYPNGMFVPDAYDLFKVFLEHDDRFNVAHQVTEKFSLEQQPPWNLAWGNCQLNNFFGFSTSNALAIKNGFPTWDSSSRSIVLDVVAPHFRPDGSVVNGTYSLVMPIELATCLWGSDVKNSMKVEISVVDQDGVTKTVVASSSLVGGLYTFTAKGFTYSANRLVIKPVLSAPSSSARKFAVRCRKGKLTKTFVRATKTCPVNWTRLSARQAA
jgi:hypothetical protein